ncbi:MAG: hypothetical protein PUD07_05940 [bacterium]|nr:hypothetical protein [bacterium]
MLFFRKKLKKATKEDEEKLRAAFEENDVGAKDHFAMLFSAFFVIILPCLLVLIGLSLLGLLLCGVL